MSSMERKARKITFVIMFVLVGIACCWTCISSIAEEVRVLCFTRDLAA